MNKPMLLTDYTGANVRGWLMSEKLDGWRVMWDGENFFSRELGLLAAPEWFKAGMPAVALDGELFAGRGEFNAIQGMMRDGWHGLTFHAFDLPAVSGSYVTRLRAMQALALPPHASVLEQLPVASTLDVIRAADAVVAAGGEGVVVRNPKGKYLPGERTNDVARWVPQDPAKNRRRSA
jgi:DNA ligase-1